MGKFTKESKAATQSVRAKIRKALAVPGAELSAADTKSLKAVLANLDKALKPAPKATKAEPKLSKKERKAAKRAAKAAKVLAEESGTTEPVKVKSTRKPMSKKARAAFGAKMKAAKAAKAAERAAAAA